MKRGDVVLIDFPFTTGSGFKKRPALIVQCDRNNGRLEDTIVAIITGNTGRAAREPTQLLIDAAHPDWTASGLRLASVVDAAKNMRSLRQEMVAGDGVSVVD